VTSDELVGADVRRLNLKAAKSGFTLAELLISMGVSSVVMLGIMTLFLYSGRSYVMLSNYAQIQTSTLNAIDQMSKEIREAQEVTSFTASDITLTTVTNTPVTFRYSSGNRTLSRIQNGHSKLLLQDCDWVRFEVYQRTPIEGTFDYNDIADTNEAKVVAIHWKCSRMLPGSVVNSDGGQMARIVLRAN
jgi:prepilin-type N-terminal cleavage/methylation domain-containing protein